MTRYFSDHFSGVNAVTLAADNSVLDQNKLPDAGIHRARLRYKRAEITQDFADGDYTRLMQFRSGDRFVAVYVTHSDSGDAGQFNIGFWETGRDHDGPLGDINIVALGVVTTTALIHSDVFGTGFPDPDMLRGKTAWELHNLWAASVDGPQYLVDPMEDWDLVLHTFTGTTDTTQFVVEVYFTSGD